MPAISPPCAAEPLLAARYRLGEVLGEGAMGTVYRAIDQRDGTAVAVKLLHPHLAADASLLARFDREIDVGLRLHHPNLVPVTDAGDSPTHGKYLVMPLLHGTDLRHEIAAGMGLLQAVDFAAQLLSALEHVHAAGFVHRDVKPENVLVVRDAEGRACLKLLDFGLAKPTARSRRGPALTEHGRVFGTPWYMPPEQAAGESIDTRADLYAVGAVTFEMLTGAPMYEGSLAVVLYQQIYAELPPLPEWLPGELATWLRAMLAKRADERPATAAAARAALQAAVARLSSRPTVVGALSLGEVPVDAAPPASMLRGAQRGHRVFAGVFATAAAMALWLGLAPFAGVPATAQATPPSAARVAAEAVVEPATVVEPAAALEPAEPAIAVPAPEVVAVVVPSPPVVVERGAAVHESVVVVPKPVSRPKAKPSRPRVEPKPVAPLRRLEPLKPPRSVDKLPGAEGPRGDARVEDGKIHLRPRAK